MTRLRCARFDTLDARTLHDLVRLRVDVFVVEQRCAYAELDGRDTEPGTWHLWAPGAAGAPAAYLRLLAERDGSRRIGRVCVAPAHRGRGLASALVDEAVRMVATDYADADVVLDAQSYLAGWYARHGFAVVGADFVEDGIAHVPMRLRR